jgi:hypothetical protein
MQKVVGSNPITRSAYFLALGETEPRFSAGIGAFSVSQAADTARSYRAVFGLTRTSSAVRRRAAPADPSSPS